MAGAKPHKEEWTKQKVKDILKELGIFYFMPASGPYGKAGIPDFICCANGLFVSIETKVVGKKPTDLQDGQMTKIRKANGITFVTTERDLISLKDELIQICS